MFMCLFWLQALKWPARGFMLLSHVKCFILLPNERVMSASLVKPLQISSRVLMSSNSSFDICHDNISLDRTLWNVQKKVFR